MELIRLADILLRNIDASALKKIDELAKKNKQSRNEFLKKQIESLAILDEIKRLEDNYELLTNKVLKVIELNTKSIEKNNQLLEEIIE